MKPFHLILHIFFERVKNIFELCFRIIFQNIYKCIYLKLTFAKIVAFFKYLIEISISKNSFGLKKMYKKCIFWGKKS